MHLQRHIGDSNVKCVENREGIKDQLIFGVEWFECEIVTTEQHNSPNDACSCVKGGQDEREWELH